MGKLGARGALETPPGRSARPRGRRQDTERMSGDPEEARWVWLRSRTREEGLRLPTLGRGGARGEGRRGARVCGEHWCGGSESLVGSPGPRWGWGHCWRIQIPFLLSFVIWWGRQVHSPAWEHLMSCGWSPPFLGHQVDWTDRPGSCFSLSAEGAKLRLGAERPEPRASLFPARWLPRAAAAERHQG